MTQDEDVERIVVAAVGLRDETVVARVMHGAVEGAADVEDAVALVEFVFDLRTHGAFDEGVDFVGRLFAGSEEMEGVVPRPAGGQCPGMEGFVIFWP